MWILPDNQQTEGQFVLYWIISFWTLYNAGETVTIVGDHDPALLKYFDCTRSGPRSAFDSNVVYQFEIMEYVSFPSLFFCECGRNRFFSLLDTFVMCLWLDSPWSCASLITLVLLHMLYACEVVSSSCSSLFRWWHVRIRGCMCEKGWWLRLYCCYKIHLY